MKDRRNRREAIGDIFRLGGLFFAFGNWRAWVSSSGSAEFGEEAPVESRLQTIGSKEMVDRFSQARGGSLVYFYQMFFPTFLAGDEFEKVSKLKEICLAESNVGEPIERARKRAVPAIAAAHALASVEGDEAQQLRQIFLETHVSAMSGDESNRMGLGVIWSCLTAALIRNEFNWRNLTVGPDIIKAASETCLEFMRGDDPSLLLLHSATAAWQFLITYQSALSHREESLAVSELPAVGRAIEMVKGVKSVRFIWLSTMETLIGVRKSFEAVTPGYMEMLIGRPNFAEGSSHRKIANYAALVRLQTVYHYHLAETGKIVSGYFPSPEVANDMKKRNLAFLACFGLRPTDWPMLKNIGHGLLTPDSEHYFDNLFANFDKVLSGAKISRQEEAYARWYSGRVPFRNVLPEERVAAKLYAGDLELKRALEHVEAGVSDLSARLQLVAPALIAGLIANAPPAVDKIDRRGMLAAVTNGAAKILGTEYYEGAFKLAAAKIPQFLANWSGSKTTVFVSQAPDKRENLTDQEITDASARLNLAEAGVIQSPGEIERRKMNTPESKASGKAKPGIPAIPSVAAAAPLFGMLSAKAKRKIRFPDRETASQGLLVLYRSGYAVDAYGDCTYGITSEKQLQLLARSNVQYENVSEP